MRSPKGLFATIRRPWNQAPWLYFGIVFLLVIFFTILTFQTLDKDRMDYYASLSCNFKIQDDDGKMSFGQYCPPATNIFFLKTHKCASSTVQNVFMRFGDKRNLSFILPKENNYIGYPQKFSRSMLPPQPFPYNVLCHHLRLDIDQVRSVLPLNSVFITVVRDPVTLFESMYDYYNITNYAGVNLSQFINDPGAMAKLSRERLHDKLGRNQMLYDMGYDSDIWENETLIRNAIQEMDTFFDFVIVFELFEESMILLKHKLCWTMEDIAYLVHNKRTADKNEDKNSTLSWKLRQYNKADQMLYDHFLRKINKNIDDYGREIMAEEVKDLKLWNNLWYNHCVEKITSSFKDVPEHSKAYSSKVYSFVLKNEPIAKLCKELATEELQFTEKLRLKQDNLFNKL